MRLHTLIASPCAISGLALLFAILTVPGASAAELRLRLLETTDLHMNLVNHDYYQDKPTDAFGLAKPATLINPCQSRARWPW